MTKNKKKIMLMEVLLLVIILFSFCLYLVHFKYNCTHNDNCPFCLLAHKISDTLNGFNSNLAKVIIVILLTFSLVINHLNNKIRDKKKYTLVGLKVELIN